MGTVKNFDTSNEPRRFYEYQVEYVDGHLTHKIKCVVAIPEGYGYKAFKLTEPRSGLSDVLGRLADKLKTVVQMDAILTHSLKDLTDDEARERLMTNDLGEFPNTI
jgi:hypothetical protein